jgi:uncharacterized protein YidB (DUF937 family)
MGLFDSIASQAIGALAGQTQTGNGQSDILGMLSHLLNDPQTGGISGLMQSFQSKGLGDIVASWIGNGANLPISAEQIQSALGHGPLQALAQQAGVGAPDIAQTLSTQLPGLIDKLTPNGQLPQGDMLSQGLGMLKGLMG